MYKKLTEALLGYWIDSSQVLFHPPKPRLSDGYLELMLPDQGVLIQFSYDELSVTVNQARDADPKEISTILQSLCDTASLELPNQELAGLVFVRYWTHTSILTGEASRLLSELGSTVSARRLEVQRVSLRLQHDDTSSSDVSIELSKSEESPNGLFLDYNAAIDKESSGSIVSVISEAFKGRADLLEKLGLHSEGNEEFASWFTTESVRDCPNL